MKVDDMKLDPRLMRAIHELGFEELTTIQEKCIPLCQKGLDVVGQSETGSGKTAAFGLPLLEKVDPGHGIQGLILTPTRELCVQVADMLAVYGKYKQVKVVQVYGGVSIDPQIDKLRKADIVVGTPGRVLDHLERETVHFGKVKVLVLDEADKMLEMGFIEDVERIVTTVKKDRQTLLFSATVPERIESIIKGYMRSPVFIRTKAYVDKSLLRQAYYDVQPNDKFSLLVHLLKNKTEGLALVFCATRREVDVVARNLKRYGVAAMAIHGGLSMNKRTFALDALKKEKIDVLVATDVAARGLDIRNVSHVYNYDVPKTSEEYVHRIGRTARAGKEGDAVTILVNRDYENFDRVLQDRSLEIRKAEVPRFQRVPFLRRDDGMRGSRDGLYPRRDGPRDSRSPHGPRRDGPGRYGSRRDDRGGPPRREGSRDGSRLYERREVGRGSGRQEGRYEHSEGRHEGGSSSHGGGFHREPDPSESRANRKPRFGMRQ